MRAAQRYGVTPWDLLEQHVAWVDIAIIADSAEAHAEEQSRRQSEARQNAMSQRWR